MLDTTRIRRAFKTEQTLKSKNARNVVKREPAGGVHRNYIQSAKAMHAVKKVSDVLPKPNLDYNTRTACAVVAD